MSGVPHRQISVSVADACVLSTYITPTFPTSQNFLYIAKKVNQMFENVVGHRDHKEEYKALIACGTYVGSSHYVIVLYGSDGTLIDINVSNLTEGVF